MFNTFRNAWKIEDLRKRILFTLFVIVVYRFGIALPVPFVNVAMIGEMIGQNQGDILGFFDFMSGGALSSASVFALTVQPYINASIIMQLLAVAFPSLDRMRKEGAEGQKKFNQIVRLAGAGLAAGLGVGYYFLVRSYWSGTQNALVYGAGSPMFSQVFSAIVIVLAFTAGAVLLMWLGEQVDQRGIGNGISIIIFAGIVSRGSNLISTVRSSLELAAAGQPQIYIYLPIILLLALASVVMVVILNSAERRVPIQYAKKVVGRKMYGGQASHIPIKVNMSGVMPIIFASALTTVPATILRLFNPSPVDNPGIYSVLKTLSTQGYGYAIIYTLLIIAFNYFYVAISYNPLEIANNLKKNNGAIPGIRPGRPTSDFLGRVVNRVTLIGAIFLVVVAVGPIIIGNVTGLGIQMGGTSLLILVGVALDTTRSLESFMLMRHHKGFLE
ncbi:preprotein translocase subunit SecY [Ruminococcaceae bacterium OttesenSCG-928-O06]|nr:preprotein translocase subunit SecY [Ruminococcaceae bacterium OttesenSCG-928-O06]